MFTEPVFPEFVCSAFASRELVLHALAAASLFACASAKTAVGPDARVAGQPANQLVVALERPCSLSPGGTPMGRPDGERGHTLPAGRYEPLFEDKRGVFFASPSGIVVTEPAPLGTRNQPGGIYLTSDVNDGAYEYLGDAERVSQRYRLPEHCKFLIENAAAAPPPG